jgi:Skp family chaperone for outer membrane proteins
MHFDFRFLAILLFLLWGTPLASAQSLGIRSTTVEYEKEQVPALQVSVMPPRKDLQDAFEEWIQDTYDINMEGGGLFSDKNLRRAEGVILAPVSADKINLFTKTVEQRASTTMYLFASKGLGNYFTRQDEAAFAGLERVFDEFLGSYLPEYYEMRITEATETLEDLRDDLDDLRNDIQDNEEEIRKLKKENIDLEEEVRELESAIREAENNLQQRRNARQRVIQKVSGGNR